MKSFYIITGGILVMVEKKRHRHRSTKLMLSSSRNTALFWENCRPKRKYLAAKKSPDTSPERKPKSKNTGESSPTKNAIN